MDFNRTTK